MDSAYHGHTQSTIDISPYKWNQSKSRHFAKPESSHVMQFPDTCRDLHLDGHRESAKVLAEAERAGRKVCAYICESLLGCGGQVVLPDGYLASVYRNMRRAGAVCIADEVQCGFGRTGSHFWGFETQGVVPDVVVLGKAMGNGVPLAGVVTTRKLADTFSDGGMEYFNTTGGCNAAIAAGTAVLRVIKESNLQQNAARVGDYLLTHLRRLQDKHAFIGDVRGIGLFLGIEFVVPGNPKTLNYAPKLAKWVLNELKVKHRVLLATDGKHSSVIKIKPPLVMTIEDAAALIGSLANVLGDAKAKPIEFSILREKDELYNRNLKRAREPAFDPIQACFSAVAIGLSLFYCAVP